MTDDGGDPVREGWPSSFVTVDELDANAVAPPAALLELLAWLVVVSPRDTNSTMTSAPSRLFASVTVFSNRGIERVFARCCIP